MPEGGELAIVVRREGNIVRVTIGDTGSGIPEEVLSRISEPFFTTKSDGHGLGLAICRSIIRDIGGDMSIKSRPGEGTTVLLSLPVHEEAPSGGE
jgi:signal transduction histidine kinase